ncbi:hypothetical protein F442_08120, partial [Phytophthora nicotianae P10297]
ACHPTENPGLIFIDPYSLYYRYNKYKYVIDAFCQLRCHDGHGHQPVHCKLCSYFVRLASATAHEEGLGCPHFGSAISKDNSVGDDSTIAPLVGQDDRLVVHRLSPRSQPRKLRTSVTDWQIAAATLTSQEIWRYHSKICALRDS